MLHQSWFSWKRFFNCQRARDFIPDRLGNKRTILNFTKQIKNSILMIYWNSDPQTWSANSRVSQNSNLAHLLNIGFVVQSKNLSNRTNWLLNIGTSWTWGIRTTLHVAFAFDGWSTNNVFWNQTNQQPEHQTNKHAHRTNIASCLRDASRSSVSRGEIDSFRTKTKPPRNVRS